MSRKGVIISVYVESSSTIDSQYKFDQLKRSQANEFDESRPKGTTRRRGYDRRAQLLAYAHELRHAKSTNPQCTPNPKHKGRRWTRRIGLSFPRLFRRKNKEQKYEQMGKEDHCDADEKKKRNGENDNKATSNFCKKLKCFLKDISCSIWQFGKK
ncbi:uncharacterized protein LOC107841912 [Capsicum annuum]|uniref:uncharacterized protein LOC107841912 n=1 Tax=Capsicum annuum TaxID=4072 RepID=UPI001FB1667D|nr:uncharacterized protein LOC107841912 [Capsicum annuum]